jgi:hypothetical protein
MIINKLPTEFSFVANVDQENFAIPFTLSSKVVKKDQPNNIMHEIEELNQKKAENEIDYITLIAISETEFKKSEEDAKLILDDFNEDDIIDILSIKKLQSFYRNILEVFSYLIGEPYFEWRIFKEKLNLHEAKFKMANVNYKNFNKRTINFHLNKISKNKVLSSESYKLRDGILKIFRWVKSILKIYLYKYQEKQAKENEERIRSKFSSNQFSINDIEKIQEKVINLQLTGDKFKYKLNQNFHKENKENNSNFFFTGIEEIPVKIQENKNNIEFSQLDQLDRLGQIGQLNHPLPKIKNKVLKLKFDATREKKMREKKTLLSLPFLKNKTFHQLRDFYEMLKGENKKIDEKHFEELGKFSYKNPANSNKVINFLSANKSKNINDDLMSMFLNSMKKDEEVIRIRGFKTK